MSREEGEERGGGGLDSLNCWWEGVAKGDR